MSRTMIPLKKIFRLMLIGIISGIVLALFLKFIEKITGSKTYHLLFDVSYVPLLKQMHPIWLAEGIFHFTTCMGSVTALYFLLRLKAWEQNTNAYLIVIGAGSAALYPLTILAHNTPAVNDYAALFYWVLGHLLFGLTTALLIKKWVTK